MDDEEILALLKDTLPESFPTRNYRPGPNQALGHNILKELKALPAEDFDRAIRLLKTNVELRDNLRQQIRLYKDVMKGALQKLAPKAFPYVLYRNDES